MLDETYKKVIYINPTMPPFIIPFLFIFLVLFALPIRILIAVIIITIGVFAVLGKWKAGRIGKKEVDSVKLFSFEIKNGKINLN